MKPKPPEYLAEPTQTWWVNVCTGFELEERHVRLLTLACEAWDRCQDAREALQAEGTVFLDRFGQPRARPEVGIERDSRLAFARLLRELALDVAPPPTDLRPGQICGNAGRKT